MFLLLCFLGKLYPKTTRYEPQRRKAGATHTAGFQDGLRHRFSRKVMRAGSLQVSVDTQFILRLATNSLREPFSLAL